MGYVVKSTGEWQVIGTRSPQDPQVSPSQTLLRGGWKEDQNDCLVFQAFYPVGDDSIEVDPGDWIAVRCVFNTAATQHVVHMG